MRPSDPDDMKYLYAAWRLQGTIHGLDGVGFQPNETPESFTDKLVEYIAQRAQAAFTLLAVPPKRDVMPVGMVFGVIPIHGAKVMIAGNFTWFPWASARNKLEATVHFYNQMRQDWGVLGFADADANFFEHVCKYGVLRRVGTVFDMFGSGATPVFQTRKPYKAGRA